MAEIKEIEDMIAIHENRAERRTVSCPIGYTPKGIRITSDRVLAKFDAIPRDNQVDITFFNYSIKGDDHGAINQAYTLICAK